MLNLKRFGELYRRFPFTTATRFAICEGVRALFDPLRLPTYAHCGEDILLKSYTDGRKPGYYVDVGCNHPFRGSNTALLYSRGWSGVVIDGNESLIQEFRRQRPFDRAICALISDTEQDVKFSIAMDDALSTFDPAREQGIDGYVASVVPMRTQRLQTIFEREAVPKRFDLLSVDVEGHDYQALTSFDLNVYRPRIVIAEILEFDLSRPLEFPTYRYLIENGYVLKSYAAISGVFVDSRE